MSIVTLLLTNIFFYSLYMNVFSVLIPLAATDWGMKSFQLGVLVSIGGILTLILNIPLASIADRFGKKRIIIPGIIMSIISVVILLLFPTIPGLVISYIIFRTASILQFIPTLAFLSIAPSKLSQDQTQGINGFIQGVSMIIGSLLAGFMKDHFGITTSNYVLLFFIIACLICMLLIPEDTPQENKESANPSVFSSFSTAVHLITTNRNIQKAAVLEITNTILFGSVFAAFYPIYVTSFLKFTATFLGITIALRSVISTLMSLTYPLISRRYGKFIPVCVLLMAGGITLLFLPAVKTQAALLVLNCILGISLGVIPAAPNTLIGDGCSKETRAMGYATVEIIYGFVSSVIPFFLGILADRYDVTVVFRITGIFGLLIMSLVLLRSRTRNSAKMS